MLQSLFVRRGWSGVALAVCIGCIAATILLSLADGILAAELQFVTHDFSAIMLKTWITDFRYVAEQGIFSAILLFVGAKFFETRNVITIAFDRLNASTMSLKGPDETHTVWIGRRYATRMEAEAVMSALEYRLHESSNIEAD